MYRVLMLLSIVLLSGCAATGKPGAITQMVDQDTAALFTRASSSLLIRASRMEEGAALAQLRKACARGVQTRLLLADLNSARRLEGSCVETWVSSHPALRSSGMYWLQDGAGLYVEGSSLAVDRASLTREYQDQARLLATARRVN
jgi:hypothetical protein